MDEILSNGGLCRCCAVEGPSRDLSSKYVWMDENEIYGEMLRDCFNINLFMVDEKRDGGICELCVTQLRTAYNFKKMVVKSEEQFLSRLSKGELDDDEFSSNVKLEKNDSDSNGGAADDDMEQEFEFPFKMELQEEIKPPRKIRSENLKVRKLTSDGETSKSAGSGTKRKKKRKLHRHEESATPERTEHRINLSTILQHSNASPFRDKTAKGFSCLYCAAYFKNINDLRAHTAQQTEKDKLNSMIDYKLSYNPIKVDITDLKCLVCDKPMNDLNELKDHLVNAHKKVIHRGIKDIILPFRLNDGSNFTCVLCSMVHISFKNLYHHMSSHYRNYCCNECGAGYITIAALRKHGKTHAKGNFPCDFCEKSYTSLTKKRNHEKGVHTAGWLRNKCPYCPETFVSYYDKSEHLTQIHNETPITYPCNACSKIYKKKFELNRHIRHHHLQQRSYQCDMCKCKFFSKRGLIDHMARHIGYEAVTCDICGKSFSRMRTLKDHLKTHEGEADFQCEICQKSFVKKSSLKGHMKLHQDDLEIFKEFEDVKHLIDNRVLTLKQIAAESKRKEEQERARPNYSLL